jgi:EmrB/QacA subfamily drug resistance transporter
VSELGPPPPAQSGAPAAATEKWGLPLVLLIVGMFMSVLDISIVNVAIPTMQIDLGASTDDIEWVTTAYTLALGVVVPMSGWIGDRLGMTRVYLFCLVAFGITSALCGLSWSLGSMIAFRILQAVPGGVLPVITMGMLYAIVPRDKMGSAMGLYGLGVVFAPAIGPTLGGYLVQFVDWRLIFFINVPVGILGAIAGLLWLPKLTSGNARDFDWWGFITAAVGLFSLLLATSEGASWGWNSYRILILFTVGFISLALFAVIELELDAPLIDLRVLKNRMFLNSLALISVLSVGMFAVLFYLPLFMQADQGIQPLTAGLILLPEALVMGLLMPFAGKLYDLVGPRWPGIIGLFVATVGGFMLCGISPDMTQGDVILWTTIRALGNGLAMMPLMTAGMDAIEPAMTGSAALVNNVVQRVASSLGLAAMTVVATAQQSQLMADRSALMTEADNRAVTHGLLPGDGMAYFGYYKAVNTSATAAAYSNVFLICALLTGVGVVLAAFMRKPHRAENADAEPTEPPIETPTETTPETSPEAMSGRVSPETSGLGVNERAHYPVEVGS